MPYQIITDATADMDWSLWDVCVIPMEVRLGQLTYLYGPNGTISNDDFYKEQQTGAETSTSQISPFEFNRVFERYLSQGKDILYLGFSSGMSGTFQNASLTAGELMERYPHRQISFMWIRWQPPCWKDIWYMRLPEKRQRKLLWKNLRLG
jgi:fatty acid-binding protein DegV